MLRKAEGTHETSTMACSDAKTNKRTDRVATMTMARRSNRPSKRAQCQKSSNLKTWKVWMRSRTKKGRCQQEKLTVAYQGNH